jgi:hypothetical protein
LEYLDVNVTHLHPGDPVRIRAVRGTIQRILVAVEGEMILACKADEYELAQDEHRSPYTRAYRQRDVIQVD